MGIGFSGLTAGLSAGRGGPSFALEPAPAPTTLTLSNTDAPDPVNSEGNVTYTIQATNTGGGDAISVVLTVVLDASLTFVSNSAPSGWTFTRSGNTVTARNEMIPSGVAPAVTIVATTATSSSDASITTTATITAANVASDQNANSTTTVRGIIAGVPRDTASKMYFPVTGAHWTAYRAATSVFAGGNPTHGWDLQETGTTNFADSIGSSTLSQPDVAMVHAQAVTGFTRLGMRGTEATSGQRAINFTNAPNPNTTSILLMAHVRFAASLPGGTRGLLGVADNCEVYWLANGHLRLVLGSNIEGSVAYQDSDELIALLSDRTHSLSRLYTTKEIITGTHVAPTSGNNVWDGGQTALASSSLYTWQVEFESTAAEYANAAAADAAIRAAMQAQGKLVSW